jgi:hypothetical protein
MPLSAQMKLSVEQLTAFIKSSVQLGHEDRRVAEYIRKVKLTHRLDDRTIEDMQGMGAGPKTTAALRELRDASKELPAPPPPAVKPQAAPIPGPSESEWRKIIEDVREYALSYSKNLPNFICTQVTRRFVDPAGLEFFQRLDVVTARLSYFEQREDYKVILVNNKMVDVAYDNLGGATSSGEFGSMMREIFEPKSGTRFQWDRWATLRGRRMHVFAYNVLKANSQWSISYEKRLQIVPGYRGLIYVDRDTMAVMRITLEAEDIPPSFPIQEARTRLDYDFSKIGDSEFVLPLMAEMRMREGKLMVKNEVEFRLYRRFSADAAITFETPEPLSEDKTKEQPPKQ